MVIQLIVTSIVSLISGGLITSVAVLKWTKRKESGIAKQEMQKGDELEISNTKELILMYKDTLKYKSDLWRTENDELKVKVDRLVLEKDELKTVLIERTSILEDKVRELRLKSKEVEELNILLASYSDVN